MPALVEHDRHAEGLRLPGRAEHRSLGVARDGRERVEIGAHALTLLHHLPERDTARSSRRTRRPAGPRSVPQTPGPPTRTRNKALAALEAARVTMRGPFGAGSRVLVGEDEHAMVAVDDADFAARVARQPRVAGGVHILGPDAIAGLEARRRQLIVHARRAAIAQHL